MTTNLDSTFEPSDATHLASDPVGTSTRSSTTLVPVAAQTAPCDLADQLEAAAQSLRTATFAGLPTPTYLIVTGRGVATEFSTEDLLRFAQLYDARPDVAALSTGHITTSGVIDGQPWEMRNDLPPTADQLAS